MISSLVRNASVLSGRYVERQVCFRFDDLPLQTEQFLETGYSIRDDGIGYCIGRGGSGLSRSGADKDHAPTVEFQGSSYRPLSPRIMSPEVWPTDEKHGRDIVYGDGGVKAKDVVHAAVDGPKTAWLMLCLEQEALVRGGDMTNDFGSSGPQDPGDRSSKGVAAAKDENAVPDPLFIVCVHREAKLPSDSSWRQPELPGLGPDRDVQTMPISPTATRGHTPALPSTLS